MYKYGRYDRYMLVYRVTSGYENNSNPDLHNMTYLELPKGPKTYNNNNDGDNRSELGSVFYEAHRLNKIEDLKEDHAIRVICKHMLRFALKQKEKRQVMLRYYSKYHSKQVQYIQNTFLAKLKKQSNLRLVRVMKKYERLGEKLTLKQNLADIKQVWEQFSMTRKDIYENSLHLVTKSILQSVLIPMIN